MGHKRKLAAFMARCIFFSFCFVFMRMSLSDLESPMCISNHWEQQPQLQATELYQEKDAHICFASATECASNTTCAVLGKDKIAKLRHDTVLFLFLVWVFDCELVENIFLFALNQKSLTLLPRLVIPKKNKQGLQLTPPSTTYQRHP